MSGISLSDNWSQHQYKSKNLERITSSVEVEGKQLKIYTLKQVLMRNLTVTSKIIMKVLSVFDMSSDYTYIRD